MSEFKYACPVCGQHMQSDSSQTGAVVDCPTCFQKIVVPQAPADPTQKLILTGSKFVERSAPKPPTANLNPYAPTQVKGSSGVLVVVGILICMGATAAFVYRGTIFKSAAPVPVVATNSVAAAPTPSKPEVVAPPANDTNWLLNLAGTSFPEAMPSGRIHGQDFISERANLANGSLILRAGTHGPMTFGCSINFNGGLPAALSGKIINVTTNVNPAARVLLHWQSGAESSKESFTTGYALRLEFGTLTNNHLPGKIYLCLPDEAKSYLAGTFVADARKPKPKK